MIDADITALPDLIPKWLGHDKDIIGGYVPIWDTGKKHPRFFAYHIDGEKVTDIDVSLGFQKCDMVGTGAIMIKRNVVEKLPNPRFRQVLKDDGDFRMGEDQYFVECARKAGFEVWVDPTPMNQRTEINLNETIPVQQPSKQNYDVSKFQDKLFIGRQQKTPDGLTMDVVGNPDIKCDISQGISSDAGKFDYVEIHHLLEHFVDIIPIMNELHRISKHGGIIDIKVPYKEQGFGDPTHKTFFDEHTFERFTPEFWIAYNNENWYTDKWYHIVDRKIADRELQVILQVDKEIEVKV